MATAARNDMQIIPTTTHGVIDYLEGAALLVAPNLFGFADLGGPAVVVPRVLGAAIIGMALLTRYELGLVKLIPFPIHLGLDFLGSALLAASPWLFGFADQPANAWVPHLAVGLAGIVIVALSERTPRARELQ